MGFKVEIDSSSDVKTLGIGNPLDFKIIELSSDEFEFFLSSVEGFIKERENRYIKRKNTEFSFRRIDR